MRILSEAENRGSINLLMVAPLTGAALRGFLLVEPTAVSVTSMKPDILSTASGLMEDHGQVEKQSR